LTRKNENFCPDSTECPQQNNRRNLLICNNLTPPSKPWVNEVEAENVALKIENAQHKKTNQAQAATIKQLQETQ